MKSAIYSGKVFHRRLQPKTHEFVYPDTMFYLDLGELESSEMPVIHKCADRFLRYDHFGEASRPIEKAVRELVFQELGFVPAGSIQILTHIRQLGYVMNPVSFYYCWSADDSELEAIVAEVHNTPWGETHCYAFRFEPGKVNEYRFAKNFHVSPFMKMNQEYVWRFSQPNGEINVEMENWEEGTLMFEAKLQLSRESLTENSLREILWKKPFLTVAVITRIYFQALKLWLKGCPYIPHPSKLKNTGAAK
ncbi:MAG: DUF1365 domain-containing protein [Fimbriimonadaceae bacterium]|nr:MAG: DUF1365 domain-containing protein [Fimbriimonadaceae bacterium]